MASSIRSCSSGDRSQRDVTYQAATGECDQNVFDEVPAPKGTAMGGKIHAARTHGARQTRECATSPSLDELI